MSRAKKRLSFEAQKPLHWREGIWRVAHYPPVGGGPWPMYRWHPSVDTVCELLLGSSVRNEEGQIVGVRYPKPRERHAIYREGLELIEVFREKKDLFALALYRRQVTRRGDIAHDRLFLSLANSFRLSCAEWAALSVRMPTGSRVRNECLRRARTEPQGFLACAA